MISIRRISLGGGFRYLMESVAVGDRNAGPVGNLARYYAETGTPPGVFMGSGLPDLDDGRGVEKDSIATEEHLQHMLGGCCDPVTGKLAGRAPNTSGKGLAVAGFDLTFSPPKSVSVAWALADPATKEVIFRCHRRAVEYVLAYAEKNVFRSRSGVNGIVEEDLHGVTAIAFTHWESRSGDPQLHDHLVIWNRARSSSDGRWRTLDSRAIFKARTALSAMHQGVLADFLTGELGVGWEPRTSPRSSRINWEISGVPDGILRTFSQRVAQIEAAKDDLVGNFVAAHRRQPTGVEVIRLRQQATIATRPAKVHRSLGELTETWIDRARQHLDVEPSEWAGSLCNCNDLPLLSADSFVDPMLAGAAESVVATVVEQRSTFSRTNLLDHAHRLLHGVRFASVDDRVVVAERITDLAVRRSVELTPPPLHHTPASFIRADGTSRLHPDSRHVYTTSTILDAEDRLLQAAGSFGAPRIPTESVGPSSAIEKVAGSGRWLDVLVGPAGAGKSTAMARLRLQWEATFGPGSVVGLAPSAAAAEVLAHELGISTENTAKWSDEHRRLPELEAQRRRLVASSGGLHGKTAKEISELDRRIEFARLRPGQLVILDEASLAGTLALDELATAARTAGAKVLLVGDWAQLGAIDAGGGFRLLATELGEDVAELADVHRFVEDWEKKASVQLRAGNAAGLAEYDRHQRIHEGPTESVIAEILDAWWTDSSEGRSSIMLAADGRIVSELNRQARDIRLASGQVSADEVPLAHGQSAGVGDVIVTRQNRRTQTSTGGRWVRNGDRWTVTTTYPDGSIDARHQRAASGTVKLPAEYVAEHVDLGYASSIHRSQGQTVDYSHVLVDPATTREALYVGATRGRAANHIYVDLGWDPEPSTSHPEARTKGTGQEILTSVLANDGSETSAHQTLRHLQDEACSLAKLTAEYQTLAAVAQSERWVGLIRQSGLNDRAIDQLVNSKAYGPLSAALRVAEARGLDVDTALPRLVRNRIVDDAEDVAAVIRERAERWTANSASRRLHHGEYLVAGLIPKALRVSDPDMEKALSEREEAIESRALLLADEALRSRPDWLAHMPPPADPAQYEAWHRRLSTIAAYRDRWGITSPDDPLGLEPPSTREQLEQKNAVLYGVPELRSISALERRRAPQHETAPRSPSSVPAGPRC